jgi:hypothetical protein
MTDTYCAGVDVVEVDDAFERITFPCFRLVFVVDADLSLVEPDGPLCVALLCVAVVVLRPSLVVVELLSDSDDVWE